MSLFNHASALSRLQLCPVSSPIQTPDIQSPQPAQTIALSRLQPCSNPTLLRSQSYREPSPVQTPFLTRPQLCTDPSPAQTPCSCRLCPRRTQPYPAVEGGLRFRWHYLLQTHAVWQVAELRRPLHLGIPFFHAHKPLAPYKMWFLTQQTRVG
jgi:hypothetical protein